MLLLHSSSKVISPFGDGNSEDAVHIPAELCLRLLLEAEELHGSGFKGYGILVANPLTPGHVLRPVDYVIFDPRRNRRNEPENRAAFHAQGSYFREFEDAGFVADSADLLTAWALIDAAGLEVVATFHVHRRQPANFSVIDYRLHNPIFAWQLIISLADPMQPVLQPFRVSKGPSDFGIDESDEREGSERSYPGPEVSPLALVADGLTEHLAALEQAVHPSALAA